MSTNGASPARTVARVGGAKQPITETRGARMPEGDDVITDRELAYPVGAVPGKSWAGRTPRS